MNYKNIKGHSLIIFFISVLLAIVYIIPLLQIEQFQGDFYKYQRDYNNLKDNHEWNLIFANYQLGFNVFGYLFAKVGMTFHTFLFITSIFFYYFVVRLMFKFSLVKSKFIFYLIILFLLPFYFAYNSLLNVVLRQGLAVIIIFAFFFPDRDRGYIYFLIVTLIASLFHASAIIFFVVYFVSIFFKKMNFYIVLFLLSTVLYVVDFPLLISEQLNDLINKTFFFTKDYMLTSDSNYKVGFSILKFFATFIPFLVYFLVSRQNFSGNNNRKLLWQCYFFISSVGMMMSGLNYYDRILLYSWILIPILSLPLIEIFLRNILLGLKK